MGEALALAEKAGVDGFELLKLWNTELVRNLSESLGVPVILSNVVHELDKVAQNRGYGEENASAIYKPFQEMAGLPVKPRG
jgi:3-hydroxyisobutyrate dehydrogenase-like beta-hydroxyacid dehydrogenase